MTFLANNYYISDIPDNFLFVFTLLLNAKNKRTNENLEAVVFINKRQIYGD